MTNYETVIGLEVHVQVKTVSKLFCGCPTTFGAPPNTNICPICAGYPGVLPVLNKKAVEAIVKTGLAVGCRINLESIFARKQYFYPDLPKNYQISQYEKPVSEDGILSFNFEENLSKIRIKRIHLEEDAGKLLHTIGSLELDYSLVDLNRTGIPLMEIVSEPDIRSPKEAYHYLSTLKTLLEYLDVSDCDMEKGSLRCDANISIRPQGSEKLGVKVELKNMNSFRGVHDALSYEIERQKGCLESNAKIVQETRQWDPDQKVTRSMRSKEEAHDYRYFPEPDLLPLNLESDWVEKIKHSLPELPDKKRERFVREYQLTDYDATVLTASAASASFFEKAVGTHNQPSGAKLISNWITSELAGRLNANNLTIENSPIAPEAIAQLVQLITNGTISGKIAKTVFEEMWDSKKLPTEIVKEKGLTQVSNETEIENWATEAISKNPKAAEEFKNGKERAIGALVGAIMKLSKGQANPELVNKILKKKLLG